MRAGAGTSVLRGHFLQDVEEQLLVLGKSSVTEFMCTVGRPLTTCKSEAFLRSQTLPQVSGGGCGRKATPPQ